MEKTGITRRIDDLGRIVIPKEIRKNLKIRDSDEIEISVEDGKIILNKYESLKKDKTISSCLYTLAKAFNRNVLFTSREKVIDYYLKNKEVLQSMALNNEIIHVLENRKVITSDILKINFFNMEEDISYIICPLIINGDLIGSIMMYGSCDITTSEKNTLDIFKLFLENYLE